jgi:hypothetical protein
MILTMNLGTGARARFYLALSRRRSRGAFRRSAALLSSAALLLAAGEASADGQAHHYISPGILAGATGHLDSPVFGALGLDATYTFYPDTPFLFGVGAFLQAQSVGFDHFRAALGPQFNLWIFGAELGAYVELGQEEKATTFGLQVAPFVSAGFVSVALQLGLPVAQLSSGEKYDVDVGFIATVKVPIGLDGSYLNFTLF